MASKPATIQQLKASAAKAAARAGSAKEQVRSAKALLKQARKAFKSEKKAAKQARRKVEAAAMAADQERASKPAASNPKTPARAPIRKPLRKRAPNPIGNAGRNALPPVASPVSPAPKLPDTPRSAADVAKSVIERLHSPPPVLAPAAIVPADPIAAREAPPSPEAPGNLKSG